MQLVTWNTQWCCGLDGVVSPQRIVEHARALADFDVLCLQEIAVHYPALPGNAGLDQVAQLRDLLHSEGLILSGVTVGESGARNANADGNSDTPRGRQGARQAQVLAPVAETRAPRAQILTDRAVDVFV